MAWPPATHSDVVDRIDGISPSGAASASSPLGRWPTGRNVYYHWPTDDRGLPTSSVADGTMHLYPFPVGHTLTVTAIAGHITVAGTTGTSFVRFGIYAAGATGLPETLVYDAGQAVGHFSGVTSVTFAAQALTTNLYWLAGVPQGAPAATPSFRTRQGNNGYVGTTNVSDYPASFFNSGYINTAGAVTGPLPATLTPANLTANLAMMLAARVA